MPSDPKSSLRWSNWNLLLLVPLLMLITPFFNFAKPAVFGLPFFYWYQFAFVPVGVLCVGLVFLKTRDEPVLHGDDHLAVDDLDAGTAKTTGTAKSAGSAKKKGKR
ncbi:DUF3311 domain-containing protein [Umezawaea tangerina]|uniref:Uncharacterized protein DUF3311 n=1 Tax=Umezawaea tangerina TaxID=84725 RepID=A0A2T0TJ85_9PSEU|nr:DUF3311 domain-containing protein [Umezawaea tangerina]PRY45784.1 uncharacterized protein DUF3311 [Umezawaea tangerina]